MTTTEQLVADFMARHTVEWVPAVVKASQLRSDERLGDDSSTLRLFFGATHVTVTAIRNDGHIVKRRYRNDGTVKVLVMRLDGRIRDGRVRVTGKYVDGAYIEEIKQGDGK